MKNKLIQTLIVMFLAGSHMAQAEAFEMADSLRSNGKIYVVVAVLVTIFAGIIGFLVRIDKKVTNLEGAIKEKEGAK